MINNLELRAKALCIWLEQNDLQKEAEILDAIGKE